MVELLKPNRRLYLYSLGLGLPLGLSLNSPLMTLSASAAVSVLLILIVSLLAGIYSNLCYEDTVTICRPSSPLLIQSVHVAKIFLIGVFVASAATMSSLVA